MKHNRAWKRRTAALNSCNRRARRNASQVLARLEVLAVTSVNPPPLTDEQILAALNPPTDCPQCGVTFTALGECMCPPEGAQS